MQVELAKEGQPVDTILLVAAQFSVDPDWDLVALNPPRVQELLHKVLALLQFFKEELGDTLLTFGLQ